MKHFGWHVMQFVLRFMCCGADKEMFHVLGKFSLAFASLFVVFLTPVFQISFTPLRRYCILCSRSLRVR